jgi:prefoldin subunit 5
MYTGNPVKEEQSEDLDVLVLVERGLLFFRRFRWVFAVALLLGLAAGYTFYRIIPKTYQSRMVLHSFLLTNPEQIQLVNNWAQLLREKEYRTLSRLMNCPEQLLHGVKKIKAKEIQQVFTPNNPNGFTVDVWVTDNKWLDSLQAGIVYAFENNEYIKQRLEMKRAGLKMLIDETSSEILQLDSTKKTLENIISGNSRSSSSLIVDGSSLSRQLIDMQEKLLNLKENLRFTSGVQVLQSFSPFSKPDGPRLLPWLIMGVLFFTGLAWAGTVVYNINQKLKQKRNRL